MNFINKQFNNEENHFFRLVDKSQLNQRKGDLRKAWLDLFNALYRLLTIVHWQNGDSGSINHRIALKIMVKDLVIMEYEACRQFIQFRHKIKYDGTFKVQNIDIEKLENLVIKVHKSIKNIMQYEGV